MSEYTLEGLSKKIDSLEETMTRAAEYIKYLETRNKELEGYKDAILEKYEDEVEENKKLKEKNEVLKHRLKTTVREKVTYMNLTKEAYKLIVEIENNVRKTRTTIETKPVLDEDMIDLYSKFTDSIPDEEIVIEKDLKDLDEIKDVSFNKKSCKTDIQSELEKLLDIRA